MIKRRVDIFSMGIAWMTAFVLSSPIATATENQPEYRRQVNFDWEPIAGANAYDLEITSRTAEAKKQVFRFRTEKSAWNGGLPIGRYNMKVRSLDQRKVPGVWSPPMEFEVNLEKVKITSPTLHENIKAASAKTESVTLSWEQVPAAQSYLIEIRTTDGSFHETQTTHDLSLSLKLPVAREYSWQIAAQGARGSKSEGPSESLFEIIGRKLDPPAITMPSNEFVRTLTWTHPNDAEAFDLTLSRLNPQTKKWSKVTSVEGGIQNDLALDPASPGGFYRLQVRALATRRVNSIFTTASFKVRDGDRSPSAEFTSEIRKSIDRIDGWYGVASYLVTLVHYSATSYDTSTATSTDFDAYGGTGRLGLGYMKKQNPWGLLAITDLSGFTDILGNNITFASTELSGTWRTPILARGEMNIQAGLYYKQIPIASVNSVSLTVSSFHNLAVAGPQVGIEYSYALTPKWGLQVNAHIYENMITLQTPSGSALPTMSWQAGFLGAFRLSQKMTGLLGFTHREDHLNFQTTPGSTFQNETNQAKLTGEYLNLSMEYGF